MTIQIVAKKAGDRIAVRIIGENVLFINLETNMMSPIEGLKINKQGVIKEHPDLKDNPEWKQIAIQRFVDKVKSFKSEEERYEFMIKELKDMGYVPMYKQRNGFRPEKIK